MPATFLPLGPGEAGRILGFMRGLYRDHSTPYDLDRARSTCEWLIANPELGGIWTIQSDEQDAGYLIVTQCVSIEFGGKFALLDELYVDEAFRGQGLGADAVEFAACWARGRGLRAIRLETGRDNERAQALYRKKEYAIDDRYLMTRWL